MTGNSSDLTEAPLVSFLLLTYNQAPYVADAVRAATAQSYSPMELMISDDCSSDGTFDEARSALSQCDCKHRVELIRNERNVGIARHINQLVSRCRGELIVMAAGDDVSLPNRVTTLVEAWLRHGRPAGIGSAVHRIDTRGNDLETLSAFAGPAAESIVHRRPDDLRLAYRRGESVCLIGCSAAWSRKLWTEIGDLSAETVAEDVVLTFRAALTTGVVAIPDILVKYRTHDSNVSRDMHTIHGTHATSVEGYRARAIAKTKRAGIDLRSWVAHSDSLSKFLASGDHTPGEWESLQDQLQRQIRRCGIQEKWWESSLLSRLLAIKDSPYGNIFTRCCSLFGLGFYSRMRYLLGRALGA